MRLSQLTKRMDRGDEIRVCLFGAPIDRMEIYHGTAGGIKKDDPIRGMIVSHVAAASDTMVVEVRENNKKRGTKKNGETKQ